MKEFNTFLLVALFCSSCIYNNPCPGKEAFFQNYDEFINDVKENYKVLDEKDWLGIDREYEQFVEKCYQKFKEEMSLSEKLDFWKNTISYGIYRERNGRGSDFNFDELEIDLSEDLEELSIETREELENFIKDEFGQDLENAIDDVIKGLESIGQELKDWLDNE